MSPTVLFFCLLLLPQLGTSSHISYTLGSKKFFVRSSDKSQATSAPASCSSIPSGLGSDKVPVVHRLSPCSPLNGADKSNSKPSAMDVYRRDVRRVRSLFASPAGEIVSAPAPAPAPGGVRVPAYGVTAPTVPGVQDYAVVVGFGTPLQAFAMVLETSLGLSLLRCKPCASRRDCEPAFDPSKSSTFTNVPCGSPDCRTTCLGSVCPLPFGGMDGSVVQDVFRFRISAGIVNNFTFGCFHDDHPAFRPVVGALDLSRDSRSVASRLATPGAPTFSYCLPLSTSGMGFLTVAAARPEAPGGRVQHAPLVLNPAFPSAYFIDLAGISLNGRDVPIPPATDIAHTTAIDVGTSFTFLKPDVYAPLRDAFRADMTDYPTAPPMHGLDTCYNFTGLKAIAIPLVRLKFGNGESFILGEEQTMYSEHPSTFPFTVACLAFAASPSGHDQYSVIGTLAQTSTEVVYDVSGGKVMWPSSGDFVNLEDLPVQSSKMLIGEVRRVPARYDGKAADDEHPWRTTRDLAFCHD
ncbi:hypothetical protein EJB05_45103, partial [Eragrostis curvula]